MDNVGGIGKAIGSLFAASTTEQPTEAAAPVAPPLPAVVVRSANCPPSVDGAAF
jgi:hypothetical protein